MQNCFIRKWEREDAGSLALHANDRDIWLNLRDGFPHPYQKSDAEYYITEIAPNDQFSYAIVVDNQACGGIGGHQQPDIHSHTIEIGYWLGKSFWGRGIMSRIVEMYSNMLLSDHSFSRVFAVPFTNNKASVRILEKSGFQLEGTLRKSAYKDGKHMDQYMFSKLEPTK